MKESKSKEREGNFHLYEGAFYFYAFVLFVEFLGEQDRENLVSISFGFFN